MISKHAGVAIAALFQAVRAADTRATERQVQGERHRMMASQLEGQRRATSESVAKQQNLDRMRGHTQAQLGISLSQQGMGYNPMLGGGGGAGGSAPFIAWSAQRG
jgi:hypothetical protein